MATSPDSAGIPSAFADAVIVVPWNDLQAVVHAFERHGPDIAAVIMEPINYNAGALVAGPGVICGRYVISRAIKGAC